MRALIDIPEKQIQALSAICAAEKLSRAEAVREAIAYYIDKKKPQANEAFGLWQDQNVDGVAYQERVRSEW
jgi:metal-responsive CopG/Arc/MetJ family transcriptional regulator